METKIPKPSLRPPTKVLKALTTTTKSSTISVKKVAGFALTTDAIKPVPTKPLIKAALRRRSKSVSDLKALTSKPLKEKIVKPIEKAPLTAKPGQKRPALQKVDTENKPKVAKVKIPDWDYKSRFNEIQKKYTTLVEQTKGSKSKVFELENENQYLQQELQLKTEQLELDGIKNELLTRENAVIKTKFEEIEDIYKSLKISHETLQNEHLKLTAENKILHMKNFEITKRLENSEQSLKTTQQENTRLETKCEELQNLVKTLKQDLENHEDTRRYLHNSIQDLKGNIRVFCRVRPPINGEENLKQLCSIFFPTETTLEIKKSRESVSSISGKALDLKQEFNFDKVFPPEANQVEVFEELAQLVQSALDGYNVCVFAYGQTGSGKTHTMQGSPNDQGMIPRTIDLIFDKIEKLARSDWTYTVSASFLEIYNENIRDLLEPNSEHNYVLRFNEGRGVTVTNLKIISIDSATGLKNLMEEAHKNRAVAATNFNEHSSRSHAVTKINLEGYNNETKVNYCGSINLVDLAGSESAKTSSGDRLAETKSINKSLSTLGDVMLALHNKDPHVPYRNSKLTFLLQSCLGGNSKTLMFVNISPFEECFYESINSLRFASKVKEVKTVAKRNRMYTQLPSNKIAEV